MKAKPIERARVAERFQRFFIDRPQVYPFYKFVDVFKMAVFVAFSNDRFYCCVARASYATQPKAELTFFVHAKCPLRFVYVWPQNWEVHAFTFFHEKRNLFDIAQAAR